MPFASSFQSPAAVVEEPSPAQLSPPVMIPQPEPSPDARTIEQRYFAAVDADSRAEIVGQLCDLNTPEAAATARRLFSTERNEDVKLALLTELAQMDAPAEREQNFGLFVAALFPGQPRTIRETAISLLADFGDARAVQVLRNLSNDPDAEIREAAADAVRELQKAN
jgi:HEAT repeat protein